MPYVNTEYGKIRIIEATEVENTVKQLFYDACHVFCDDVKQTLENAAQRETSPIGKKVLCRVCENYKVAEKLDIPICQDTGMAVVFAEVGENVHIAGADLCTAIEKGVARAYTEGGMRLSVVRDPLYSRVNTNNNTPAVIHIKTVPGDRLKLTAAPKGFGSENMSFLHMFTPSASEDDIAAFVTDSVKKAGSNPCPPVFVGVGLGSDFEGCALLAKQALLRPVTDENPEPRYAALEKRLLGEINALGIGPQGFGGSVTALAVKIEQAPTHIAGLPAAVNINCHVIRHKEAII